MRIDGEIFIDMKKICSEYSVDFVDVLNNVDDYKIRKVRNKIIKCFLLKYKLSYVETGQLLGINALDVAYIIHDDHHQDKKKYQDTSKQVMHHISVITIGEKKKIDDRYLVEYISGKTYANIGEDVGLSRERIRQVINNTIKLNIYNLCFEMGVSAITTSDFEFLIKKELKLIKKKHRESIQKKEQESAQEYIDDVKKYGIEKFNSVTQLNQYFGDKATIIKKYFPEIYKQVSDSKKKRWSEKHDCCKVCKKTENKHRGQGYCYKCYGSSKIHKDNMSRYYQKNKEKIDAYNRKYAKQLLERSFDNNREKAIIRDNEKCVLCGITRESHKKLFGRDLNVHRKFSDSNDLDNLVTLCTTCHMEMNKDNYEIL